MTAKLGLLALLEAKPGKGDELGSVPAVVLVNAKAPARSQ